MPYLPLSHPAPSVPHVVCRDGYYWGDRRASGSPFPCRVVELRALTVQQVSGTYEGDAQSRAQALSGLTEGQRAALYPTACACGRNHWVNPANLVRAWGNIAPGARPACAGLAADAYIRIGAVGRTEMGEQGRQEAQVLAASAAGMRSTSEPRSSRSRV